MNFKPRIFSPSSPFRRYFRRFYPRSMFLRFFLLLAAPMLATQAVSVHIFYNRHWSSVSKHMVRAVEGEIRILANAAAAEAPFVRAQKAVYVVQKPLYLSARLTRGTFTRNDVAQHAENLGVGGELAAQLAQSLPYPFRLVPLQKVYMLEIALPSATLSVYIPPKRMKNPSTYIFILWMTGTGALMSIVAALFVRGQVRSVTRLASAMGHVGRGEPSAAFSPSGAREVRAAGEAFISMKNRIERFVRGRTDMLRGISHDIKTPIARIKLQLAMMSESGEAKEIDADLDEMTEMLDAYLEYLRAEATEGGVRERVDVATLLEETVQTCRKHGDATIKPEIEPHLPFVTADKPALKRAFVNCVRNAMLYGGGAVRVKAESGAGYVRILIEDNGDGVPEALCRHVFRPFYRIGGKSAEPPGSGLGLAVAKDAVERSGGSITMESSAFLGGAKCVVRLPIS